MINSITLIGNLVRDIELKYNSSGYAIGKISIAVNKKMKDNEKVNYFDVVIFGKMAESLSQYLLKGKRIGLVGELDQNRWQDADGNNKSKIEILANNIQLL